MNLIFSIMGLVGGLLCCTGDLLFDLKGKGNKKLGTSKNIDSKRKNYVLIEMRGLNNEQV